MDTLTKLAANPVSEFVEVMAPPGMYKKEDRTDACILHDFPVNSSGERIIEIELEAGSEASPTSIPLPLIQDESGKLQVVADHVDVEKTAPADSEDMVNNVILDHSKYFLHQNESI